MEYFLSSLLIINYFSRTKNIIMKNYFLLALALLIFTAKAQDYPQNMAKPLDIPLLLSGTFGELRGNHFHSGLDIKTKGIEGLKVFSAEKGYVSRIKISHGGYGKALYITHPNGYTTVYGHLKKFSPRIEKYIKAKQYKKESYTIQVYPKASELVISKKELIAFSGNTGGSFGAHLHYEIRKTAGAIPHNPMLFGIDIKDTQKPVVKNVYIYPISDDAQINQSDDVVQVNLKQKSLGSFTSDPIIAFGKIGVGVNTYDKQDGSYNWNGVYNIKVRVNGLQTYEHQLEKFSFGETHYINLLLDYERYIKFKEYNQRLFITPNNKLSIYKNSINNGFIDINEEKDYLIEIIISDFKGNESIIKLPIIGKDVALIKEVQHEKVTLNYFDKNNVNYITGDNFTATFRKNTFYENFYFDFQENDSIISLHNNTVPVRKSFTINFDVSKYTTAQRKHMYIAQANKKGNYYFRATKKKGDIFSAKSKALGNFKLDKDTIKPTVKPFNFAQGKWLSSYKQLIVKIKDNKSGIKYYRATINGKWILMEYESKKGALTYNFSDNKTISGKQNLKIIVLDNAANKVIYNTYFYRKESNK